MKSRSKVTFVIAGVLVVLAIVLYSCGGGGGGGYGGGGGTTTSTVQGVACSGATTTVSIVSQSVGFTPPIVTVTAGSIVQWTNNDPSLPHTVTRTTVSTNGFFDSGNLAPGASVCLKFTAVGTFDYHCSLHPTMTGEVIVQ